jgi:hypothetical protein
MGDTPSLIIVGRGLRGSSDNRKRLGYPQNLWIKLRKMGIAGLVPRAVTMSYTLLA